MLSAGTSDTFDITHSCGSYADKQWSNQQLVVRKPTDDKPIRDFNLAVIGSEE